MAVHRKIMESPEAASFVKAFFKRRGIPCQKERTGKWVSINAANAGLFREAILAWNRKQREEHRDR